MLIGSKQDNMSFTKEVREEERKRIVGQRRQQLERVRGQ